MRWMGFKRAALEAEGLKVRDERARKEWTIYRDRRWHGQALWWLDVGRQEREGPGWCHDSAACIRLSRAQCLRESPRTWKMETFRALWSWKLSRSLVSKAQKSLALEGAGKSFLKLEPVFTDDGGCVGRVPASLVQVSGVPEFHQAELEERINTEQLSGSSVFLKDFYREENNIYIYRYKTKYYKVESKFTHIKISYENAKVWRYLVSLRSKYQTPESLSKLFSTTGDIWAGRRGGFLTLSMKSALTLTAARLRLCHQIAGWPWVSYCASLSPGISFSGPRRTCHSPASSSRSSQTSFPALPSLTFFATCWRRIKICSFPKWQHFA